MSNGASKVIFFEAGNPNDLGEYLMYNPPAMSDEVTWGENTYLVIKRNVDIEDNMVRITVKRVDNT